MTTSYYLVGVGTGHVLAQNKEGKPTGVVLENKGDHDDEQKWTVERGDEPDVVALKSVANGKYMNCPTAALYGEVGTGDKQWWKLSNDGLTPNVACRFNLIGSPDHFLYTNGSFLDKGQNLKVWMNEWKASFSMACLRGLTLTRRSVAAMAKRLRLLLRGRLDRLQTGSSDACYQRDSKGKTRCFEHQAARHGQYQGILRDSHHSWTSHGSTRE
jgi:hypothetical protein